MTADELRKLAEIAGFYGTVVSTFHNEDGAEVPIEVYLKDGKDSLPVILWQPHIRIEQAYSVENGIPEEKRREYIYQLIIATGQQGLPPTYNAWNLVHATADQRCRAALAASKEG